MAKVDPLPFVSVIIPTFNDDEVLETCLHALERQNYPKDCYEVIVINNNPNRRLAVDLSQFEKVREDIESQPGSYAARNKGVKLAKGEVLAFTDADCIPACDWLYQGIDSLKQHSTCGILAGAIQVVCRDENKPTAVELYDLTHAFPQQRYVNHDHYGATANVFTFKNVFETVGFFDAALQSGGDFEWGQRVYQAGYQVTYAEHARISHPARYSFQDLKRKNCRVVKGHHRLMKQGLYSSKRFLGALVADLLVPYRTAPKILQTKQIRGLALRLKVLMIAVLVRYVRAWQRLQLGIRDIQHYRGSLLFR